MGSQNSSHEKPTPVESVSQAQEFPVVIAIDGSSHSQKAFDWFSAHVKGQKDVILVHAIHPPPVFTGSPYAAMPAQVSSESFHNQLVKYRNEAKKLEAACMDVCRTRSLNCRWVQMEGDAGLAILHAAKENNASLVVMGSRGIGTLRRTILGSVSDYVLHHSQIPTLIIPVSS